MRVKFQHQLENTIGSYLSYVFIKVPECGNHFFYWSINPRKNIQGLGLLVDVSLVPQKDNPALHTWHSLFRSAFSIMLLPFDYATTFLLHGCHLTMPALFNYAGAVQLCCTIQLHQHCSIMPAPCVLVFPFQHPQTKTLTITSGHHSWYRDWPIPSPCGTLGS